MSTGETSNGAGKEHDARAHEYELGHSDRELKRLRLQAQLVDPITRQFFQDAGLEPGMRVLDVGSGGGDTALLAAELVGDGGEVVGVDTVAGRRRGGAGSDQSARKAQHIVPSRRPGRHRDSTGTFDAAVVAATC